MLNTRELITETPIISLSNFKNSLQNNPTNQLEREKVFQAYFFSHCATIVNIMNKAYLHHIQDTEKINRSLEENIRMLFVLFITFSQNIELYKSVSEYLINRILDKNFSAIIETKMGNIMHNLPRKDGLLFINPYIPTDHVLQGPGRRGSQATIMAHFSP